MGKIRSNKGMPNNSNKSKKSKKPISDKPNNEAVDILINKGVDLMSLGKFDEAIEYFNATLKIEPNNTKANYNKGLSLANISKYKEAIVCLDKALDLDVNNIDTYMVKGSSLGKLGKFKEAIICFNKIIALESTNVGAYSVKGISLGELGKLEEALECFDKSAPENVEANYNKGIFLSRCNEYEKAVKCFAGILKIEPKNINAFLGKGVNLGKFGKLDEALECFDRVLTIDSENINAYTYKGAALGDLDNYEDSLECFNNALEIDSKNINALYGRGISLYKLNKHIECHQWIQECIAKNIINYRMFSALYLFYKDNKDYEQDIEQYIQKTIAIESDKNSEGTEFYQYSPFSKEIIYNITNQEIYFSDPSNFNDPFDPLIRILNTDDSEDMLKLLNFRISCLSTNNSNILMWSHYANKHQGICIKYNIAKLLTEKDIIFKKTEYIQTMPQPQSGFHLELSDTTTIIDAFTQKHESWEYEEEYKLIVRTDKDSPVLKKCDIEAIYLGKDISPEDAEFIKNTVKNTDIKLYQMKINDYNIFELKEQEL